MLLPQRLLRYAAYLGKGEVECSIHSVGTIKSPPFLPFTPTHVLSPALIDAEPCTNMRLKRGSGRGKSGEYVPHRFNGE
jgi:hypothetical protein